MADINVFTITGRLTKDAVVRTLASGKKVLTADTAVNTGYGDYKKTLFVKVQMWGDRGEKIKQYLTKGQPIGCSGSLSRNEWGEDDNKKVDFVLDVNMDGIQLLGSGKKQDSNNTPAPDTSTPLDENFEF